MDQLFGLIERITFSNPETGFSVVRLKQPRKHELITIVGVMPSIKPGENVRCLGVWKTNAKHGVQFEVHECHIEAPSDLIGIQRYLESGLIRGIGPAFAKRIVSRFGTETLKIIEENPDKLQEIKGVGEKKINTIKQCWKEQKAIRDVMVFLQKYGVSPAFAQKIYKAYQDETIARMQENPYELARLIHGIGFKTADAIAKKMGFPNDALQRIDAGIEYVLAECSGEGHTCFPLNDFIPKTKEILEIDVTGRIDHQCDEGIIVKKNIKDSTYLWSKGLYLCELGIARELNRISKHKSLLRIIDTEKAVHWVENLLKLQLADNQKEAVQRALTDKIHIITGGPGTGKSTITKAILAITKKLTKHITLAAPTGRAAKRMNEITGHYASTIHALLQFDFRIGQFRRNHDNPLKCDLIVVDEASMIDTHLMYHLLKAIPNHARLLIIGDVNQLPSVGPGAVLNDIIRSTAVSVTRLTEIYRQAAGSKIITNAHRINHGEFPDIRRSPKNDFFFIRAQEPGEVLAKILDLVSVRLPKYYRFDPIEDIQILSPMKRGIIGIYNLNVELQKKLNPREDAFLQGGQRFAVGDKVMQTRNNYTKEAFNGDIGRITHLDREEQEITIDFDGRKITYSFLDVTDEITLSYAASIHKFQGSEYPCVVIPVHTSHYMMLRRNLLYTGVTRGKRLVVLVGSTKALAIGVKKNDVQERHTGLLEALIDVFNI